MTLGCHIAREVELVLQNGLRFKFRESQELGAEKFLITELYRLYWVNELLVY